MAGGTKRLQIDLNYNAGPADQAAQQYNNRQKARIRELLSAEEAAERAKNELIRQANAKRIQDALAAAQKADRDKEALDNKEAARQERLSRVAVRTKIAAIKQADAAARDAAQKEAQRQEQAQAAMKKMGAAVVGLGATLAVNLVNHWDKIRADAFAAAEDVMRMRGAVRELQALRGELGQTGPGMAHVFEVAGKTLQKPEEAQAMEAAGLGVGELALKTDEDRAQFTKAMIAAGRFQTLEGGDAGAYGQMMGQIALQGKGPLNAEDMEARAFRLFQIQQPGGFRTMSQAMGQYAKLNGLVQNEVYTPEEAMGLASAFSVSSPEEAATKTEQFTRSVMAGRIKARGMAVSPDVDFENTADYFKQLGITENDSAIERGKKIARDLAAQQAKTKNFNAQEYLISHGFGNMEDRQAIMDFAGLLNTGKLEKIEAAQNAPLEQGAITKRFEDRVSKDNFLQGRAVEIGEQAATAKQGLEEEPLVLAQRAAFNRLKAQGKISGTFEEWRNTGFLQRGFQDIIGGYHHQVNAEASRVLSEQRKQLGLPQNSGFQLSEYETMKKSAREIQEAGGDVTGGAYGKDLPQVTSDLREAAKELKAAAVAMNGGKAKVPAPMAGRPMPIPVRP